MFRFFSTHRASLAAAQCAAVCLVALTVSSSPAWAQNLGTVPPRIGVGFDVLGLPPGQDLFPEGIAIGLRGRVALPLNADLSLAGSVGVASTLFAGGTSEADWLLSPQVSLIVTTPQRGNSARYFLGGFGGLMPLNGDPGGFALHGGVGWAIPLRETSVYVEVDPALIIGEVETTFAVPLRAGVIF